MVAICEWNAWAEYLIGYLPEVEQFHIRLHEGAEEMLARLLRPQLLPSLVIMHVNLSRPHPLPVGRAEIRRQLLARGIPVWNALIEDTTKRSIQRTNQSLGFATTLAARDGAPDERVIVKDNNNHHAFGETSLTDAERAQLGLATDPRSPLADEPEYLVMPRAEVPADWWEHPAMCIERYVDNADGDFYRVYLAGKHSALCTGRSDVAVRRMIDCHDRHDYMLRRDFLADPVRAERMPAHLRPIFSQALAVADALHVDYGSLDVVVDEEGGAYVVDVNPTPYWGNEAGDEMIRYLGEALLAADDA